MRLCRIREDVSKSLTSLPVSRARILSRRAQSKRYDVLVEREVLPTEGPILRFDLSITGICGAMSLSLDKPVEAVDSLKQ